MLRIEPLAKNHDREGFDCGVRSLDLYLQNTARQHSQKGVSKTFVLVDPDKPKEILGYFTLSIYELKLERLPPGMTARYPSGLPPYAILLARLAVSKKHQRKGLGSVMIIEAMHRALSAMDVVGGLGLFVEAKDEDADAFYKKHEFVGLTVNPYTLFLPLETIRAALMLA